MKRIFICLSILIVASAMGYYYYRSAASNDREQRMQAWIASVSPLLREGDIAFRRGCGFTGNMVIMHGEKEEAYSHVGMVCQCPKTQQWMICHAVPHEQSAPDQIDRVKYEPLEAFYGAARATHGEVMRAHCSDTIAAQAASKALQAYLQGIPFDHHYLWGDTTELYCTELIVWAYDKMGIDLVENRAKRVDLLHFKGEYVFPSHLSKSLSKIASY